MTTQEKSRYNQFIGLTEREARDTAEELGVILRVTEEDGVDYTHSCEYRMNRVNVALASGLIIEIIGIG